MICELARLIGSRLQSAVLVLPLGLLLAALTAVGWSSPAIPGLEGPLLLIWDAWQAGCIPLATSLASEHRVQVSGGMVTVVLEPSVGGRVEPQAVHGLGGMIMATSSRGHVKARVPLSRLAELASLPGVGFIRRPFVPVPLELSSFDPTPSSVAGAAVSQGVPLFGGVLFHSRNLLGQGVRVAVIDVGFSSLSYALESGDLPQDVLINAMDFTGGGLEAGGAHGTVVAEIVHDVAPKATLYLCRIGDEVDLDNAVTYCIEQDVDVIVHSVGWVNTNFCDGTGLICDIARRAAQAGIVWVNAAGNHARRHWVGAPVDEDRDGWYEFLPGDETLDLVVDQPGWIEVYLTWDEWPGAAHDLDLFLIGPDGGIIASSESPQSGTQPPTEDIRYFAQVPGSYAVRVRGPSDCPVRFQLISLNHRVEPAVAGQSLLAPADASQVIAVGAIHYANWESGPQEAFSSQGPTADGRTKPDLMGPDGVSTFLYPEFLGTSGAAPHVAGAAALLLQQIRRENPSASADQIIKLLTGSAIDMGPPGVDSVYGWGRLQLDFGLPQATRDIDTPILGDAVPSGEWFTVRLSVYMPYGRMGGITLREEIPQGFSAVPLEAAGAEVTLDQTQGWIQWEWPCLGPGERRVVVYQVVVGESTAPGSYCWVGTVNGQPVEGEAEVQIRERLSVLEAVAYWNSAVAKVDLHDSPLIDDEELAQARSWWFEDAPVPGTGGRHMTFEDMLSIVSTWASGTLVDQAMPCTGSSSPVVPPILISAHPAEAKLHPGASVDVLVTVEARATVFGFGLEITLPQGWDLTMADPAGGWFRQSAAGGGEWIWPGCMQLGERKTVRFTVHVPWSAEPNTGVEVGLVASCACPEFEQEVDGCILWVASVDRMVLTGVSCVPNPVVEGRDVRFAVAGAGIESVRVKVFTLSGQLVFDSGWREGSTFQWGLYDMNGQVVSNGVYLYLVSAKGVDGGVQTGDLGKLLVLR